MNVFGQGRAAGPDTRQDAFTAFLVFAHRLLAASEIALRPALDSRRFFVFFLGTDCFAAPFLLAQLALIRSEIDRRWAALILFRTRLFLDPPAALRPSRPRIARSVVISAPSLSASASTSALADSSAASARSSAS